MIAIGMLDRFLCKFASMVLVVGVVLSGCSDSESDKTECEKDAGGCACPQASCRDQDASIPPSRVDAATSLADAADASDVVELLVVGRVLDPVADATVTVTVRGSSTPVLSAQTSGGKYDEAGYIAFDAQELHELDDEEAYVITIRGGDWVDKKNKKTSSDVILHVVLFGKELKQGDWNASVATELVYAATITVILSPDAVKPKALRQVRDDAARKIIGTDLNGDGDVDYGDALVFDPREHAEALLVPLNALTITLIVNGKETTLAEVLAKGDPDDIQAAFDALLEADGADAGIDPGADAAVNDAPCWPEFADCSSSERPFAPPCPGCSHPLLYAGASMGDPHIRTFDGLAYDMQGVGEFILVKSTSDELEVQTRTAPWGQRTDVAINKKVALRVGTDRVTFDAAGEVKINGEVVELDAGFTSLDNGRIYRFGTAYTVEWPDGSQARLRLRDPFVEIEVLLAKERRQRVIGLLGTFDGSIDNELLNRNGEALPQTVEFASFYAGFVESWRVKQDESLFDYAEGETTQTFTDRSLPKTLVTAEEMFSDVARDMCSSKGITDDVWLDACMLDLVLTESQSFLEGLERLAPARGVLTVLPPVTQSEVLDFPEFVADPSDELMFGVVQTIPPNGSAGVDPKTAIVILFDDTVDPGTVDDVAVTVTTSTGDVILGRYSGALSESGNSILYFQPFRSLPEEAQIIVNLATEEGLLDKGGNTLRSNYQFSFATSAATGAPEDLGFEVTTGWSFAGDGEVLHTSSLEVYFGLEPTQGDFAAGISTGNQFSGTALEGTTSSMTSGPIEVPEGAESLVLDYNFLSEEFDTYVGREFDDFLTVTVSGPNGVRSQQLASVNAVGADASTPLSVSGYQETGWIEASVDVRGLGSPLTVSFTVSDVGDSAVTSVGLLDALRFE